MFGWAGSADDRHGVGQTGLMGDVRVAGPAGWCAVDSVAPGDLVLTFDAGMQPVAAVLKEAAWTGGGQCPTALWPIEVPPGALGNRELLRLAADQAILIESDEAEALTGDPFALVSARSLAGVRGIDRAPLGEGAQIVTLTFAVEQVIFAAGGAMLHCPADMRDLTELAGKAPRYSLLDGQDARRAAACLDAGALQARSAGLPGIRS